MSKQMRAIGLMSGTSMDGIDVALIETDGDRILKQGPSGGHPYPPEVKAELREALNTARQLKSRTERPGLLGALEETLTGLNAAAIAQFLAVNAIDPGTISVVGYHGQTVLHDVARKLTVQLGDGRLLAARTGFEVVYDMRAADVAAGGQGAPLVPVYHRALAARLDALPVVFVNIGGVANVTWIGADGRMLAFDTGPGNALIDDWMLARTGSAHDEGGATAARGKVDADVLTELLSAPYFTLSPPKSLDRGDFSAAAAEGLSLEDGAATLTAFTAGSIARAREHMPQEPRTWVVCGGGRRNKTLMSMLAGRVENAVVPVEALGLNGDFIEAQAWGYMAVRSLAGLPITFPETTGVGQPMTGGVVARPA